MNHPDTPTAAERQTENTLSDGEIEYYMLYSQRKPCRTIYQAFAFAREHAVRVELYRVKDKRRIAEFYP